MKVDDSGMPEESYWNSLFDIPLIVKWLDLQKVQGPIAEIGCGYGTFTIPIASEIHTKLYAFDIEPALIETTAGKARRAMLPHVLTVRRDVLEQGTGLGAKSVGLIILFNILHSEDRRRLLEEASRILLPQGIVAILHWRKDIPTPRGPAVDRRPDMQAILDAIAGLDLELAGQERILEPYHWGIQLRKI